VKISLFHFGTMIALPLSGSVFAAQSPYQSVQPDPQAVVTASQWLSVVDAGNYAESFAMFPARIRSGGDAFEKQWVSFLRMKRAPLGHVLSRKLIKAWFTKTLPGSPDGYYEFFHYNSSFQHKTQAAESVVLTKESGNWRGIGLPL
jgi:Protein of unknown function (DUF4019)